MVGHLGAAPSFCRSCDYAVTAPRPCLIALRATHSPIRTARIAVFLVPGHVVSFVNWWSHGELHPDLRNAIESSCYWTMAPKLERAPGLAPGKDGFAIRRLDGFGIARVKSGETNGICTRTAAFTEPNAALTSWSPSQLVDE